MTERTEAMREEIARAILEAHLVDQYGSVDPDAADNEWFDWLAEADALLPIIARERERAARAALEAAGDVCAHWAECYAAASDTAKVAKQRFETRDFETMGMTCRFREADIRALSPADIVKGMK